MAQITRTAKRTSKIVISLVLVLIVVKKMRLTSRVRQPLCVAAHTHQLSGIRRSKYRNVGYKRDFKFVKVFNHSLNNELAFAGGNISGFG